MVYCTLHVFDRRTEFFFLKICLNDDDDDDDDTDDDSDVRLYHSLRIFIMGMPRSTLQYDSERND